jgi:Protein of unknown function (DUF4238)
MRQLEQSDGQDALRQNRADLGIAEESRFQGLGISSSSSRQIGLFNIKSQKVVPSAPIKSQCSKDYFYTKDPQYEDRFSQIESAQRTLLDDIQDRGER